MRSCSYWNLIYSGPHRARTVRGHVSPNLHVTSDCVFSARTKEGYTVAFAATGVDQPLEYALGLILGGIRTSTIGWRRGFFITAIGGAILFLCSFYVLLPDLDPMRLSETTLRRLAQDIDRIGVLILSAAFGLLTYVLA